jgi:ribonuclease-3
MPHQLEELERRLGYSFTNRSLLLRALTHKSAATEQSPGNGAAADNEQFEFLGDAVLGFIASDYLMRRFPSHGEGVLSRLKAHVVSAAFLYQASEELGIGGHLLLGRGEELSGGRAKRALLANAMEAIIAAIYFDAGLEPCREFVERQLLSRLRLDEPSVNPLPLDSKSALQELAQARGLPMPRYLIVRESGPEHSKTFTVEVRVGKNFVACAEGHSKKAAGQRAAQAVLEMLGQPGPQTH